MSKLRHRNNIMCRVTQLTSGRARSRAGPVNSEATTMCCLSDSVKTIAGSPMPRGVLPDGYGASLLGLCSEGTPYTS